MEQAYEHRCTARLNERGSLAVRIDTLNGPVLDVAFCPGCAVDLAHKLIMGAEAVRERVKAGML